MIDAGIRVAKPEMMALAHLLEHPLIRHDLIPGTDDKRSNKDLGRAIAIARLTAHEALDAWPESWVAALRAEFPTRWRDLCPLVGNGVRALLLSPRDLQQAARIANNSLLAGRHVTADQLGDTARRLLAFVGERVEGAART